jgi:hypothetical protein
MTDLKTLALGASVYLAIDAARRYGLVTGGPDVDVERCEELIARAEAAGLTATREEIDAATGQALFWYMATPEDRAAALGEDVA